ncbi:MAG: dephospho-CoA kinase [Lactococcus hircilactis]
MSKVIGLTGGIASGKSTVVDFLSSKGYFVIDADKVVRELQEPGGKLAQRILKTFGPSFFESSGVLDRQKLGKFIFSDEAARQKLAELQNQTIREEIYRRKSDLLKIMPEEGIVFMDIPLLFEQNYDGFDEVWLVAVDHEIQLERVMQRDHLSRSEARLRIAAQMSLKEKKKKATRIIDSSGTILETRKIVEQYLLDLESH